MGAGIGRLATSLPGPSDWEEQAMDAWVEGTPGLPWAMDPPQGPEDLRERREDSIDRRSGAAEAQLRLNVRCPETSAAPERGHPDHPPRPCRSPPRPQLQPPALQVWIHVAGPSGPPLAIPCAAGSVTPSPSGCLRSP